MSTFLLILLIAIDIFGLIMGCFCPPMLLVVSLPIMVTAVILFTL